jgi:hypothetical protein
LNLQQQRYENLKPCILRDFNFYEKGYKCEMELNLEVKSNNYKHVEIYVSINYG